MLSASANECGGGLSNIDEARINTECLEAYPNDVSKCEGLKKLYEIDKDAVEALGNQRTRGVILLNK